MSTTLAFAPDLDQQRHAMPTATAMENGTGNPAASGLLPPLAAAWVARLAGPMARWLLVVALCAAYLLSGVSRLMELGMATGALQHVGLAERAFLSGAEIILELGALGMVLLGVQRWLAALLLAGFAFVAAYAASTLTGAAALPSRLIAGDEFLVQACLALGFLLVAFADFRFGQDD